MFAVRSRSCFKNARISVKKGSNQGRHQGENSKGNISKLLNGLHVSKLYGGKKTILLYLHHTSPCSLNFLLTVHTPLLLHRLLP
jgi:hypothetical protein